MAIAQDDAIRLPEPSSQDEFIDLTTDEDTDEDTLLGDDHRAPIAQAHIEPIDLTTSTQSRNLEQALLDSLQQMSELNQVLKDFLGQTVTQTAQRTVDLHSRGKGEYIASEPRNAFDIIPARSARQRKAHKSQRMAPKTIYRKGRRLGQSARNVILDAGGPTHTIEHNSALSSASSSTDPIRSSQLLQTLFFARHLASRAQRPHSHA